MILNYSSKVINEDIWKNYIYDDIVIYYTGIFFEKNKREGIESIKSLAEKIKNNICIDFINYFGAYSIIIKIKDKYLFFSDNSNLHQLYYNNEVLCDSLLEYTNKYPNFKYNDETVFEIIRYKHIYSEDTIIEGLKSTRNDLYYIWENGKIDQLPKNIGTLNSSENSIDACEFSKMLNYSLGDTKKCLSLTGGFDSRYILALFQGDKNFETALTYTLKDHPDCIISEKVASIAKIKHSLIRISKPKVNNDLLINTFRERQGEIFSLDDSTFRLSQYVKILKDRGVDCIITGDTGIFHKSEEWYHVFPFYRSKYYSLNSFYKKRILGIKLQLPLSEKFLEYDNNAKKKIINLLDANRQEYNTKAIDWYNWEFNAGRKYPRLFNSQSFLLSSYAPLMEYRFVTNAYNQKRTDRMMAKYMKKYITNFSKDVASVKTVNGITTSSESKYKLHDLFFSFVAISTSALRLLGRVLFKKVLFSPPASTWSCYPEIRGMDIAQESLDFAKNQDWIREDASLDSIDKDTLARIIEFYLLKRLSKRRFLKNE